MLPIFQNIIVDSAQVSFSEAVHGEVSQNETLQIAHGYISKDIFIPEDVRHLLDSRQCGWYSKASKIAVGIACCGAISATVGAIAHRLTEKECRVTIVTSGSFTENAILNALECGISKGIQYVIPSVLEIGKKNPYFIPISLIGGGSALFGGLIFLNRFTSAQEAHKKSDEQLTLQATEKLKIFYDGIADSLKEANDVHAAELVQELKQKLSALHAALKAYGLNSEAITEKLQLQLS